MKAIALRVRTLARLSAARSAGLALVATAVILPSFSPAAELHVDFARTQQTWDGFGANYVETRHTRDHGVFAQDYGGFKYLEDAERERVIDLVFGDDGLRVGLLKIFLDPFHERENDNNDPLVADPSAFDHETTTRWIRHFAQRGLEKTRARGDDLAVLVGLYGPPGWMTRQECFRGRDLKPGHEPEIAEYLAVFARYLRDVARLPVRYISMHNEGEARERWAEDGRDAVGHYHHDYNLWWPDHQVVEFLRRARAVLDANGLPEVGLASGETATWQGFSEYQTAKGPMRYASAIRRDPAALANLGLITSHGFALRDRDGSPLPGDSPGARLLRERRPDLHAWTTSSTWGRMDVDLVEDARRLVYEMETNGLIPWAMVHHNFESDKLSPPATFRVSGNANSPIMTSSGDVEVTKAYFYYKQLTRAGQPGMKIAHVTAPGQAISGLAFAGTGTRNPNAFVVINTGLEPQVVHLRVGNAGSAGFRARVTTDREFGDQNYADAGILSLEAGRATYEAPPRSATTFFELRP